jgi:hypothetical protein
MHAKPGVAERNLRFAKRAVMKTRGMVLMCFARDVPTIHMNAACSMHKIYSVCIDWRTRLGLIVGSKMSIVRQ